MALDVNSQSSDQNYIHTQTPLTEESDENELSTMSNDGTHDYRTKTKTNIYE